MAVMENAGVELKEPSWHGGKRPRYEVTDFF